MLNPSHEVNLDNDRSKSLGPQIAGLEHQSEKATSQVPQDMRKEGLGAQSVRATSQALQDMKIESLEAQSVRGENQAPQSMKVLKRVSQNEAQQNMQTLERMAQSPLRSKDPPPSEIQAESVLLLNVRGLEDPLPFKFPDDAKSCPCLNSPVNNARIL
jgi:hypothetical protein